jgi:serine/threonine protein kinase
MERLGSTDPKQLGPFRLLGVLGVGGTGTVYLGRGAPVRGARKHLAAVRAMRPELLRDRQLRARMRHDLQTAATTVRSPYVATALGCELDSERPWVATEFVPSISLGAYVSRHGPLPEPSVRALGGALARALGALHAARIAHRDLNPANVLLGAGSPRAVDYGLGLGRPDLGHTGEAANPADDMFELGATLVLAAGGHHPFPGHVVPTARDGPDLTGVPEGLCPALLACLHKTPESRPLPGPLARSLDLEDNAERDAAQWLPDPCLREIDAAAAASRRLTGRRLFGR